MDADAPGTLFVEKRTERAQSTPVVRRIVTDGAFFEHTDQEAKVEGGRIVVTRVAPAWRQKVVLAPEGLDRVRTALRGETGFFDLPAQHEASGLVSDGGAVTWTACLDGREHTVTVNGTPITDVPAIARLNEVFEGAIAEALDRSSP